MTARKIGGDALRFPDIRPTAHQRRPREGLAGGVGGAAFGDHLGAPGGGFLGNCAGAAEATSALVCGGHIEVVPAQIEGVTIGEPGLLIRPQVQDEAGDHQFFNLGLPLEGHGRGDVNAAESVRALPQSVSPDLLHVDPISGFHLGEHGAVGVEADGEAVRASLAVEVGAGAAHLAKTIKPDQRPSGEVGGRLSVDQIAIVLKVDATQGTGTGGNEVGKGRSQWGFWHLDGQGVADGGVHGAILSGVL